MTELQIMWALAGSISVASLLYMFHEFLPNHRGYPVEHNRDGERYVKS